jgi:2-haloacid dehalogenase
VTDTPEIEALIFDFGGVLVDWDPRHLYRKLFDDEDEMEAFLADIWSPAENDRCDRGRPYADMIDELVAAHPHYAAHITAVAPWERWQETVAGPVPGALELLRELRAGGYRLCGLSNWSAETFPLARDAYECFSLLDDIVISGELDGIAKPDRQAFELVAQRNGLIPAATVFVDDSPRNTAAARSYGYRVATFTDAPALRRELAALGVRVALG